MNTIRLLLKKRNVLSLLLCLILVLSLCACKKKEADTPNEPEQPPVETVQPKPEPAPAPEPEPDPGRPAQVTAKSGLRLRTGPGKTYDQLLVIPSKAQVTVFKEENGWAEVEYDGTRGWCSMDYLSIAP